MQARYFVVNPSGISEMSEVSDAWDAAQASSGTAYEAHLIIDFRGPETTIYTSPAELIALQERLLGNLREELKVAEERIGVLERENDLLRPVAHHTQFGSKP